MLRGAKLFLDGSTVELQLQWLPNTAVSTNQLSNGGKPNASAHPQERKEGVYYVHLDDDDDDDEVERSWKR
jgi:hypothetical protein